MGLIVFIAGNVWFDVGLRVETKGCFKIEIEN